MLPRQLKIYPNNHITFIYHLPSKSELPIRLSNLATHLQHPRMPKQPQTQTYPTAATSLPYLLPWRLTFPIATVTPNPKPHPLLPQQPGHHPTTAATLMHQLPWHSHLLNPHLLLQNPLLPQQPQSRMDIFLVSNLHKQIWHLDPPIQYCPNNPDHTPKLSPSHIYCIGNSTYLYTPHLCSYFPCCLSNPSPNPDTSIAFLPPKH